MLTSKLVHSIIKLSLFHAKVCLLLAIQNAEGVMENSLAVSSSIPILNPVLAKPLVLVVT